jgi:nucleotide-binding universal stress UspA family protein
MTTFVDRVPSSDTDMRARQMFRRALVPVQDASHAEPVVELARRAGVSEARVLHLNLRESISGRRFALETGPSAARAVEATVLELRMAGIAASGVIRSTLVDRAAEAIIAEAVECGADLIVLGPPRRGEFGTRLFGSVTLRVLEHAPCPVLVASPVNSAGTHRDEESADATAVTGPAS